MARSILQAWADGIAEAIQIMREYPANHKIKAEDFRDEILAIKTGVDTNDGTATDNDILYGKVAYSKEQRLIGTILTGGTNQLSVSGNRVTTAGGYYYPDSVHKEVEKKTLATPSISVNSSTGLITASESQTSGYVDSSTKTKTYQMSTISGQTITPKNYQQLVASPGTFVTGYVYVGSGISSDFPILTVYNSHSAISIYLHYRGEDGLLTYEIPRGSSYNFYVPSGTPFVILPADRTYSIGVTASNNVYNIPGSDTLRGGIVNRNGTYDAVPVVGYVGSNGQNGSLTIGVSYMN